MLLRFSRYRNRRLRLAQTHRPKKVLLRNLMPNNHFLTLLVRDLKTLHGLYPTISKSNHLYSFLQKTRGYKKNSQSGKYIIEKRSINITKTIKYISKIDEKLFQYVKRTTLPTFIVNRAHLIKIDNKNTQSRKMKARL